MIDSIWMMYDIFSEDITALISTSEKNLLLHLGQNIQFSVKILIGN